MRASVHAAAAAAAVLMLAGCQRHQAVSADQAWVRLPGVAGRPGAAYFTLHGGSEPSILVAVSAPFAVRAELHQSMPDMTMPTSSGGEPPMTMAPLKDVTLPAAEEIKFEPGGRHVMLFDVAPKLQPGDTAPLTLSFADGKKLEVQAKVVGAGDAAPK